MGRYLEEFTPGEILESRARKITQEQIDEFAELTLDRNPLHVDEAFARKSIHGGIISHGPMMVGMAFGLLSEMDVIDGTILALRGISWNFNAPIRPGDEVRVRAEVTGVRPSSRHTDRGYLELRIDVLNQNAEVVQVGTATGVMQTRPG